MAHDDKDCSCPEKCCVMAASSCEGKRASWSSCSKEALEYWAPGTPDSCLQRPEVGLSAAAICGNGLVEAGETCDCHHHDTQCKACCVKCKLTGTTCYTTLPPKLKKNALTNETRQFVGIFIFFLIIAGVIALIYWYVTSDKSKRYRTLETVPG
ncbi:hypothetical protein HDE_06131 [Halotydeus destructor]|nr:hypothetical protein HDE_06131 [Halotydeus destructor]